jgi:GTP-binding protein
LGVFKNKVIADIPGLIEGASLGRGLGISFLKHIEKVGTLLHCISSESSDPIKDYGLIRKELGEYNQVLLEKTEVILITKSDLTDKKKISDFKKKFKSKVQKVLPVSIHDWESVEELKRLIAGL